MNSLTPSVSVLIVCHNRRDECLIAVESALAQDYGDLEVLVFDDCSHDGTVAAVRERFPDVRVYPSEVKRSATVLRNRGFEEARGEVIFSLDDDSYFSEAGIVSNISKCFLDRPTVAVVGIPYIEPFATALHAPVLLRPDERIAAYTGCAAALRRSAIREVGGYRECFDCYGGEEGDLAIRLRDRGYDLIQGRSGYIVHTKSPKRDLRQQRKTAIRNTFLGIWLNFPVEHAIWRSLTYSIGLVKYRFSISAVPLRFYELVAGLWATMMYIGLRAPVRRGTYHRYRRLPSHGRQPWDGVAPEPCVRGAQGR